MSRSSIPVLFGVLLGLTVGIIVAAALVMGSGVLDNKGGDSAAVRPNVVNSETAVPTIDVYATAVPVVTPIAVSNTAVQYILALTDVTIHSGPTFDDAVIGTIFDGQIAKITGANEPTGWWRVMCPDDTVGSCWVPSDTKITTPTQPPASVQAESSIP